MIQVKIGTIAWEACPDNIAKPGYVLFGGTFVYDTDGFTALMLWDATLDAGVGNVRAMSAGEITAFNAGKLTALAQQAKVGAANSLDFGALQRGTLMERLFIAFARIVRSEVNIVRASVMHRIVSINRVTTVATVVTPLAHGLLAGNPVSIAGADVAGYNLTTTVATVINPTTFTYAMANAGATPATGSLSYTWGAVPPTEPRTDAQLVVALKTEIAATAE